MVSTPRIALTEETRRTFADNGFIVFREVVDANQLDVVRGDILREYARAKEAGGLFSGGGTMSGHLNCFPGAGSRFVYETLEGRGIFDMVRELSAVPLRAPNIGCNLNLPGSGPQNEHVDGYAKTPFLIVNVAARDTDLANGAMEVLPGTHRKTYKYWQLLLEHPARRRLIMKRGDVAIRTSALWHRGMPNATEEARPMLAFTWEDGGSTREDPYGVNEGRIAFFPNRFGTGWRAQLRERAFVAAPRVGLAYRAVQSLFER
jgi:ectoine hydroxylase-related dioxygenase (phytanoyl-CoA dioxygenase family)